MNGAFTSIEDLTEWAQQRRPEREVAPAEPLGAALPARTVAGSMPLDVRSWICACGAAHDRDVNAAINILAAGRAERLNACGGDVGPPLAVADADEAGSLTGAA